MGFVLGDDGYYQSKAVSKEQIRCLSDETRLKIIKKCAREPRTVSNLVEEIGLNRQTAYYHLQELSDKDLLKSSNTKPKVYSLSAPCLHFWVEKPFENSSSSEHLLSKRAALCLGEEVSLVVNDVDSGSQPIYRYKCGEVARMLESNNKKLIYTASEASQKDVSRPFVALGRPGRNSYIPKALESNPVRMDKDIEIGGSKYKSDRIGLVAREDEMAVISGNSSLGVSAAIEGFKRYFGEISDAMVFQGFGDPRSLSGVDKIASF